MNIAIGNDHAGTSYKFKIIEYLKKNGIQVINFGTDNEESMDYPDAIHPVAEAVESGKRRSGNYYMWKWKWSCYDCKSP